MKIEHGHVIPETDAEAEEIVSFARACLGKSSGMMTQVPAWAMTAAKQLKSTSVDQVTCAITKIPFLALLNAYERLTMRNSMREHDYQSLLAKALPGHTITTKSSSEEDPNEPGKYIFTHQIEIGIRGFDHKYICVTSDTLLGAWKQIFTGIQKSSLTRDEHAGIDRVLKTISTPSW